MKKLFAIALMFGFTLGAVTVTKQADAQVVKLTTKTITAADTLAFTNVGSDIKAFQYTFTETSGTTAGKVYLEGTINGTYVLIDSLALTDVATAQTKVFTLSGTTYLTYRFRNTNTSSATGTVKAAYLRRPDE